MIYYIRELHIMESLLVIMCLHKYTTTTTTTYRVEDT